MTTEEFSNEFDTLVSSYSNGVWFDEYEKSVFLTKAQESVITGLYNGSIDSFEDTEEVRRYLNTLVKTWGSTEYKDDGTGFNDSNSIIIELPEDVWYITYEYVTTNTGIEILVVPTLQDELYKTKNNPFKGPNRRRALRLDCGNNRIEILLTPQYKDDFSYYKMGYLSKPSPIILTDLTEGLYINNENKKTECKLHSAIHRTILESAVKMAISSKSITAK